MCEFLVNKAVKMPDPLSALLTSLHIFALLYPRTITEQETKDYELKQNKEFVPSNFITAITLYD